MSDNKIIEQTAQAAAKEVISELKKQELLKTRKQTPFQKTETLLYNYNNYKSAIDNKMEQIKTIQSEGVPKKSTSVVCYSSNSTYSDLTDDEKADIKIDSILESIQITKNFIHIIDEALDSLKNDPYFQIVNMKYFNGVSREEIAEYFNVDASTISRQKNRLINILQIKLFSDEVIRQLFT